jgi:hypothetical protein
MKIDTTGVVATPPAVYIKEAGVYVMKIVELKPDGYSQNGNENVKVVFDCQKVLMNDGKHTLDSVIYKHEEKYCADQNLIWKVAILRDALRAPESFDFDNIVGYSVIADIYMREHNGKYYGNIGGLSYSKANDKLAPIPEAKEEYQPTYHEEQKRNAYQPQKPLPIDEDLDTDSIPF